MALGIQKAIFNIITSILIMGGYGGYVFILHADKNIPRIEEAQFWGSFMLTMIVVTIILKIVLYIVFAIIKKMKNEEEDLDFMDEYDKKIEMRSDRNGNHIFILALISSMIPIALGEPIYMMFIILISGGFVAGLLGDVWKIYYYKRGI